MITNSIMTEEEGAVGALDYLKALQSVKWTSEKPYSTEQPREKAVSMTKEDEEALEKKIAEIRDKIRRGELLSF